jgi:predicted metal-binding membrane protein
MNMADPGVPEMMATGTGLSGWVLYLFMWGVMMIAMMYPSSVPLVRLYHGTLAGRARGERLLRVGAFLGGYTFLWTAVGVVPLLVNQFVPLARVAGSTLLGGTLLLLGAYQLSPYKDRCLRHCRTPLGFLLTHSRPGTRGAARMGLEHGWFCLGCCWALFAFMVVVGTMNLVWMAVITVVLSVERTVSWGDRLARVVGVTAGVAGVVVLVAPVVGIA